MSAEPIATTVDRSAPWHLHTARIVDIRSEIQGVRTYTLQWERPEIADVFRFRAGQFTMIYRPGFGEAALSISSDPNDQREFSHTIREVGNVTRALAKCREGDQWFVRGPFGSSWPIANCVGHDLVIAAGGLGLAPLRPVIYDLLRHRERYGRVWLLYGARTPADLLYKREYELWKAAGIDVRITVDFGDIDWQGLIGVVPTLLQGLPLSEDRTWVFTCGPEIMMRYVVQECRSRRIADSRLFLSMERNMSCALGFCGHCQLGPAFVCKDGPVFSYSHLEPYLHVEDL